MPGKEFEEFCSNILSYNGFSNISLTQASGDYGVDIIAEKGCKRYAIQCKRLQSNVGVSAIQEITSGKLYYKCDYGIVLTNSYFTNNAINLAEQTDIILWDKNVLSKMIANQCNGISIDDARTIANIYADLFSTTFELSFIVDSFKTHFDILLIKLTLNNVSEPSIRKMLDFVIPELNQSIGFEHDLIGFSDMRFEFWIYRAH